MKFAQMDRHFIRLHAKSEAKARYLDRFRPAGTAIMLGGLLAVLLSGCAAGQLKAPCGPLGSDAIAAYDEPKTDPCGEAKPVNQAFSPVLKR